MVLSESVRVPLLAPSEGKLGSYRVCWGFPLQVLWRDKRNYFTTLNQQGSVCFGTEALNFAF